MDTILRLGVSRFAAAFVLASGGATLALVAVTPLGFMAQGLLAIAVGVAALASYRSLALRKGWRVARGVLLRQSGEIEVMDDRGSRAGMVRAGSFVAPWLTIIRWRPDGGRWDRTLVILPDMLAGEDFRRVRVLLRWS